MSEWQLTTLGEAASVIMGQSPPGNSYNVNGDGLPFMQGSAEFGTHTPKPVKWCSEPARVAEKGDLLLSVRAPVGDTNLSNQRIATGRGLAIIRAKENTSNKFLRIVIQFSIIELLSRSGSGMFTSITAKELRGFPIALPPLAEQRRIVDVMEAVDAQIEALKDEILRARALLSRLNSDLIEALPKSRTLGEFTETRSGPSYAATDVSSRSTPGSVPVIGIPNTRPDGSLDLSKIGYVVGLPGSVAKIDESSLVLIRTNGNRQRIGNVYMPPRAAHEHAVSAFQFLMKIDDPADREFVFWLLREPSMQAAMSEAASGTTGLGNLAVRWLNAVQAPWSDDPTERAGVVAPLRVLQDTIDAFSEELARLRTLRSTLLSALLNQEIETPESYDALLEAAV